MRYLDQFLHCVTMSNLFPFSNYFIKNQIYFENHVRKLGKNSIILEISFSLAHKSPEIDDKIS